MHDKYLLKIDYKVKEKIDFLADRTGLDNNALINKLIENNELFEKEANSNMKNINKYKKMEVDAFDAFDLADSMADGIYAIDRNGIVIAINRGYTEITGIEENEIVGKHIEDVWREHTFYSDSTFAVLKEHKDKSTIDMIDKNSRDFTMKKPRSVGVMALEQKKRIYVVTTIKRNRKTLLIIGTPVMDEKGKVVRVLTVMRDLTEVVDLKKKVEEIEKEKKKYLDELKSLKESRIHSGLIGESNAINRIRKLIDSVAKTDATVLITGETGVGKEVVARELYINSKRKCGPYVKVNCAAIPETLLEAELFGYEKGAFTGAQQKEKLGLFETANNGTILLDEIGEMSYKLQSKLLRVLQDMEIKRVGGTKSIKVDVRVIAATNQSLLEQIKKGEFREDLYYRLNVIPIEIPPLRERKEDITILVYNFIEKFNKIYNKNKEFETEAIEMLESYDWPGNIRELENSIQRLIVIGDEKLITKINIVNILGKNKFTFYNLNDNATLKDAVRIFEKNIVEKALKKYGSTHKAAKVLGITQSTVVRKAKALGIKNW